MLKLAAFLLIVPGIVGGLLPLALVLFSGNQGILDLGIYRHIGVALMAVGATLYVWSSFGLATHGSGIPAPIGPTRFLVSRGPYRHVRNPMYIAGSLFLFGEAIAWEHVTLFVYAALVTALYHPAVVFLEEPALRERFGETYVAYCAQVPRWLPRLAAIEANGDPEGNTAAK